MSKTLVKNIFLALLISGVVLAAIMGGWNFFNQVNGPVVIPPSTEMPPPPPEPPLELFSYDSVSEEPVAASYVEVSGCNITPRAVALAIGSPLKIVNSGDVRLEMFFYSGSAAEHYTVRPKSEIVAEIKFQDGPGKYNYECLGGGKHGLASIHVIR